MSTFADYETSQDAGQPVELYVFRYQATILYYCTDATDFFIGPQPYTATQLSRTDIQDTGDIAKSDITLTAPRDFPIAQLFGVYPPSDVVTLTIYRVQRSVPTDPRVYWKGRVMNASWANGNSQLQCSSMFSAMRGAGVRKQFSKLCTHVLYGTQCRLAITSFQSNCTIGSVNLGGVSLVSADFALAGPSGYLAGGRLDFQIAIGVYEYRMIKTHIGDTVTIPYPITQLLPGNVVKASAGCDHTRPTCISKFGNLNNYGGFPDLMQKNPFGTESVF